MENFRSLVSWDLYQENLNKFQLIAHIENMFAQAQTTYVSKIT